MKCNSLIAKLAILVVGAITISYFLYYGSKGLNNIKQPPLNAGQANPTAQLQLSPDLAKTHTLNLGANVTMEFILVQPGRFLMGSDPDIGDGDETPRHQVTITQPFYLGKYEVTQEQWEQITGYNPSEFKGKKHPVDSVSWDDCQIFLKKLAQKTGRKFALPTEAQWEFACRAGTSGRWHFGDVESPATEYAWIDNNSGLTTHPVGMKKANQWGLFDMNGNVHEWCNDWYANPYPGAGAVDPQGPATGVSRVLRGGAWGESPGNARSAYRNCIGPNIGHNGTGLRCVMLVNPDASQAQ